MAYALLSSTTLVAATSTATAFFINKNQALTCAHCIPDGSVISLSLSNGKKCQASVVFVDKEKDVALVNVDGDAPAVLPFGDSDAVNRLDAVYVFGFPMSSSVGTEISATEGKLNARREFNGNELLQIDATVNPGNSGGAVLDKDGLVIGIVTSKLDALYFTKTQEIVPERINFVIPSTILKTRLKRADVDFNKSYEKKVDWKSTALKASALITCSWKGNEKGQEEADVDGKSAFFIGYDYYKGEGGRKQSFEDAFKWFEVSAKKGDMYSQAILARMYREGTGVKINYEAAFKWYAESANKGYEEAQLQLARMYKSGEGIPRNYAKAAALYKVVAATGDADAQNEIGEMYINGLGVDENDTVAVDYFIKAAASGHARAFRNYGYMLANGYGVKKDEERAYVMFLISIALGNAGAKAERDEMELKIDRKVIKSLQAEAEKLFLKIKK